MLSNILQLLILTSTLSLAQTEWTCRTGEQPLQAFSPICPLTLTDGVTQIDAKEVDFFYMDTTYKLSGDGSAGMYCGYGGAACFYGGTGTTALTLNGGGSTCPATTINEGRAPQPSAGGNFRKRSAAELQAYVFLFNCPIPPLATESRLIAEYTVKFDDGQDSEQTCLYGQDSSGTFTYCRYSVLTGNFVSQDGAAGQGALIYGPCPTSACPSQQYTQGQTRRAVARRQVDTATLRRRAVPRAGRKLARPKRQSQQ